MTERRSERITIRVTPSQRRRISQAARDDERGESDWARMILMQACPEEDQRLCKCGHRHGRHRGKSHPGGMQCLDCQGSEKTRKHRYTPQEEQVYHHAP